jgi:hypothetical protein
MLTEGISGIAKHLNQQSTKSAIRGVMPQMPAPQQQGKPQLSAGRRCSPDLQHALKEVGCLLGGALPTTIGFNPAVAVMVAGLSPPRLFPLGARDAWFTRRCRCSSRRPRTGTSWEWAS